MNELISIRILRPKFEDLSPQNRKMLIDAIAKDIAEQIIKQEELRKKEQEVHYWQNKLLQWQIEDMINEQKHEQLKRNSSGT